MRLGFLRRIRPSNLILFAAAPFIAYLFASNPNYGRSLVAIIGVETNAGALFYGYCLLLAANASGAVASIILLRGLVARSSGNYWTPALLIAHFAIVLGLAFGLLDIADFIDSAVANSVDPYESDLVKKAVSPRQLTEDARIRFVSGFILGARIYLVTSAILFACVLLPRSALISVRVNSAMLLLLASLNALAVFYLLFVAHAGFASGLFLTLRATVFAYLAAAVLGLVWAAMQGMKLGHFTIRIFSALSALLFCASAFFAYQPKDTYALIGSFDARVAIIKGTPQGIADKIRFGDYEGALSDNVQIRSAVNAESALKAMAENKNVSAAFVPIAALPEGEEIVWEFSFLPDKFKYPAIATGVLAAFLALLVVGAHVHQMHPLAIATEFFIDTIRGIPMLVIILYIGLPLSGAVKSASGGIIDFSNLTRGIIAISIGYSAFMAEIFRAGINAVPTGQIEAARSLGLNRWHVARFVVLPQALKIVIPPLGNEFIAMLKDTSLLSILSVRDITQRMREFQAASFLPFAPFNSAAILYVFLTLAAASLLKSIERRSDRNRQRI